MRRREPSAQTTLRADMLAHYETLVAERPYAMRWYRSRIEPLREDRPLVLAGWELGRWKLPQLRRGVHAFYRVGADGSVVEVVPRRDPADPRSIVGWDPV